MKTANSLLAAMILISGSSAAAENGFGNIKIHGVVIDAPCSISPGDDNLLVDFGQLSSQALQNGHESPAVDIDIRLSRCSAAVRKMVRVTFNGDAYPDGLFSAGVSNNSVGILIRDSVGNSVLNGKPVAWQNISDGDNVLQFTSVVKGRSAQVTPGDFQAQVLFTIDYN